MPKKNPAVATGDSKVVRRERFTMLLSIAEKQELNELAQKAGLSASTYARRESLSGNNKGALTEAIKKIEEATLTILASIESQAQTKGSKE